VNAEHHPDREASSECTLKLSSAYESAQRRPHLIGLRIDGLSAIHIIRQSGSFGSNRGQAAKYIPLFTVSVWGAAGLRGPGFTGKSLHSADLPFVERQIAE